MVLPYGTDFANSPQTSPGVERKVNITGVPVSADTSPVHSAGIGGGPGEDRSSALFCDSPVNGNNPVSNKQAKLIRINRVTCTKTAASMRTSRAFSYDPQ
jgi:hypothetical protein